MPASTYYANASLNHYLGGPDLTRPATVYVALHTADPGDAGSNEVSGNAYARAAVTNNNTNWPAASTKTKTNGADIDFPTPTPSGWGEVTHFSLWDAPTGGNQIVRNALSAAKTINSGDPVSFPAGSLTITVT